MNLSSYINLCKPKIVALLTVTALIGMLLSVNFYTNLTNVFNGLASLVGFALLAAASAALNQIFDRETDKNMSRTKSRPLAAGNISLTEALTFTAILLFVGSSLMLYFSNLLTLMITTFGFIFYSLIYTIYLKWATPQNIVIGGLSGALPPLIGWTAVSNEISLMPLILVLIIFGVMLTNKIDTPSIAASSANQFIGGFGALAIFIIQVAVIYNTPWKQALPQSQETSTDAIGKLLLTEYLLPFEIVSILLLAALMGAALLSRKN